MGVTYEACGDNADSPKAVEREGIEQVEDCGDEIV